ncbi:MAG TPA: glycine cleavage system protein GcvH [Actinomycetota bacterium]|nr:glycine cleavage system protein GcvH [Actinomycetota bacterium]
MNVPEELKYTKEHEWVRLEGPRAVVGITDFAQDALGDVVYADVPEVGTQVRAGEPFGEVESTKSVSDVYAPLTGNVVDRNPRLADTPEILNEDPYGDGWMVVIELSDETEVAALLEAGAYRELTESEGSGS